MNAKTRKLLLKMVFGRIIILLVIDLILAWLIISGLNEWAKNAIVLLMLCLSIGFVGFLLGWYNRVLRALRLSSREAQVTLRGHTLAAVKKSI